MDGAEFLVCYLPFDCHPNHAVEFAVDAMAFDPNLGGHNGYSPSELRQIAMLTIEHYVGDTTRGRWERFQLMPCRQVVRLTNERSSRNTADELARSR